MSHLQSFTADPHPPADPQTKGKTPNEEDEGSDTERENDRPPAFPALDSAQRAIPLATIAPTLTNGSPPKRSLLMPPPSTTLKPLVTERKPRRQKVALAPGFGPLDWAMRKSSMKDLGEREMLRITPSQLRLHNMEKDAWTAINGQVYDITPYLPFHPGGPTQLLRVAGRDGTRLFSLTHSWVNVEFMLDSCCVGFLIPESVKAQGGQEP